MAVGWNPRSEFLREPHLLIPRKKPVGSVRIDRGHPLAKGVTRFVPFGTRFLLGPVTVNGTNFIYDYAREIVAGVWPNGATELPTMGVDYITGDGGDGGAVSTSTVISSTNAFTVMARFRPHTLALDNVYASDHPSGDTRRTWQLRVNGSNGDVRMIAFRTATNSVVAASGAGVVSANTWHTLCGTFNVDEAAVYVDGKQEDTTSNPTGTVNIAAGTDSYLCRTNENNMTGTLAEPLDGDISWVAAWERTLSQAEIADMHKDPYQFLIPA